MGMLRRKERTITASPHSSRRLSRIGGKRGGKRGGGVRKKTILGLGPLRFRIGKGESSENGEEERSPAGSRTVTMESGTFTQLNNSTNLRQRNRENDSHTKKWGSPNFVMVNSYSGRVPGEVHAAKNTGRHFAYVGCE